MRFGANKNTVSTITVARTREVTEKSMGEYIAEPTIMYKIVVASDSHHDIRRFEAILPIINSADYLVYCGDGLQDVMRLRGAITVPIACVKGNNDMGFGITDVASVTFGKTKALITHGNKLGVRGGVNNLVVMAKMKDCSFVFFGHTHRYTDVIVNGVHCINPGALCNGSYAMVAGDGKNFVAKQCYV